MVVVSSFLWRLRLVVGHVHILRRLGSLTSDDAARRASGRRRQRTEPHGRLAAAWQARIHTYSYRVAFSINYRLNSVVLVVIWTYEGMEKTPTTALLTNFEGWNSRTHTLGIADLNLMT